MQKDSITLQMTAEQRELIDQAASLLGTSHSEFMLEAACARARAVVADPVSFVLDAEQFERFTAMLDAPACPNPGLDRLLTIDPPWEAGATFDSCVRPTRPAR